jgi:hypothetical protein
MTKHDIEWAKKLKKKDRNAWEKEVRKINKLRAKMWVSYDRAEGRLKAYFDKHMSYFPDETKFIPPGYCLGAFSVQFDKGCLNNQMGTAEYRGLLREEQRLADISRKLGDQWDCLMGYDDGEVAEQERRMKLVKKG